jgi:hypothetical protein
VKFVRKISTKRLGRYEESVWLGIRSQTRTSVEHHEGNEGNQVAYHLTIFKTSTAVAPTVDLYLGSAHTVSLYWESPGHDIGLLTMSTITERADSEAGFCLSGTALTIFRDELKLLIKHWDKSHRGYELSPHHFEVMTTIISTLDDKSFDNATLMIC